jgi:hypothetical protein
MRSNAFDYKIAYGCWLNDSRTEPIINEDWPSIRIDQETLASLETTMAFIKAAGYNTFDVFGLITNNNWKDDIVSTVDEERKNLVRCAIDIVHKNGIKLIYGLGIYSWGFELIIKNNPATRGTSKQVMCASSTEAEKIMYKVIDYVSENYDVDGFHLEAADQGRCNCEKCSKYNDIDYYNRINMIVAGYIRNKWPGKILLVNTSGYLAWGDVFSKNQLEALKPLSESIDVFIDIGSHGHFVSDGDRKNFIQTFKASFGTSNGFWIYPPQRWDRLRWFIPHLKQNINHLGKVFNDGGRSCELYLSPLINPAVEITVLCNGIFLNDIALRPDEVLKEAIDKLYNPADSEETALLYDIFSGAENIFMTSYTPERNRTLARDYSDGVENIFVWSKTHPELAVPGEFFLERLFGVGPGYPCYLVLHFNKQGRQLYYEGMKKLLEKAVKLKKFRPRCGRTDRIVRSLTLVITDITNVMAQFDS